MKKKAAVIAGLALASACATVPEDVPVMGGGGNCDADRAQSLIGRTATTELGTEAARLTGATALRWITPDSAVTMDYRPDRLNIKLDAQNRITSIRCG